MTGIILRWEPGTVQDGQLTLRLADTDADLLAAQRLRYRVFVTELGAIGPTVNHETKTESDAFDAYYDHLLLIDRRRDPAMLNHVVGVYRLLKSDVARQGPGFYSESEFDLAALARSGLNLLELGRSCVDADYRGGVAMHMMWNGLADYVLGNGIDVMFGVASYHGVDISAIAQSLSYLHYNHLAPGDMRVSVRAGAYQPLDLIASSEVDRAEAMRQTPALIKGYLRLGGFIGDGAYIDRNFNTTDVCLIMDTARMSARHRQAYTRKSRLRA